MKRIGLILMVLGTALIGFNATANAGGYPPDQAVRLTATPSSGPPGFPFTATVSNCFPGETVIFTFLGETVTTTCSTTTFQASAQFTAPDAAGVYSVTAQLTGEGAIVPVTDRPRFITINVEVIAAPTTTIPQPPTTPSGTIPATGASGIDATSTVAIILVGAGALLLLVAQVRRRSNATPA